MTREDCFEALFAQLQSLQTNGVVTDMSRKVRLLEDLTEYDFPALYLAADHGSQVKAQGQPPVRILGGKIYLYAANPDADTSAETALNGLIDAVEGSLDPGWMGVQTLGGLVNDCWIEGAIEIFAGVLGQRAAAIVPIKILMP